MSSSSSLEKGVEPTDEKSINVVVTEDPDAEFGGTEARKQLERKLLWKIDMRMSIMVVIYILNYVSSTSKSPRFCLTRLLQIDRNNAGCVAFQHVSVFCSSRCFPQSRKIARFFARLAFDGSRFPDYSFNSLCRLHSDANTLVRHHSFFRQILALTANGSPSHRNMLLNYLGKPSIQLPIAMMIWGMISCLTGEKPR